MELEYEDGIIEFRGVIHTHAGDRRLIVSRHHRLQGTRGYAIYSASRLSILTSDSCAANLSAALPNMGISVVRKRFGTRTLSVTLPPNTDLFATLSMLEEVTKSIGEVRFVPRAVSSAGSAYPSSFSIGEQGVPVPKRCTRTPRRSRSKELPPPIAPNR